MDDLFPPPPGFVPLDEQDDYYPVSLVTAYRPGADWEMGLDPEIEGRDEDAHGNPILGRSTMEDYLDGRADYVTVAMDRNSSWQGQYLESPHYPGVVFKVMDNGGFGNERTGNSWVDIAVRDPLPAREMKNQNIPFRPITEEQARDMVSARTDPPEGFISMEDYQARQTAKPQGSYFATREQEVANQGRGPNFPPELVEQEGQGEDRIPLEGEVVPPPKGFIPTESLIEKGNI